MIMVMRVPMMFAGVMGMQCRAEGATNAKSSA
jgi:hypothetical protein